MNEKTTFELQLLAATLQLPLSLNFPRSASWAVMCKLRDDYQKGDGFPVAWMAGKDPAQAMSQSRMLKELAEENRLHLSGKTRAHAARLDPDREAELLNQINWPSLWETLEAMQALRSTRCKGIGDGWQLIADHKDSEKDRTTGGNQVCWTWNRLSLGVLRGWVDMLPSMQAGYVFTRSTEAGHAALDGDALEEPAGEYDEQANDVFWDGLGIARQYLEALRPGKTQNIGSIPFPASFGPVPSKTLCRMLRDRSKEGLPQ